jgi:CheY-like chemotaxis protein
MGLAVLIVEDEPAVRTLLQRYLQRLGYYVECAVSAETAIEGLQAGRSFDIFLVDLTLPGLSGAELARRLLTEVPAARILLTSGHAFEPDENVFPHHRVAFLRKPFPPAELLRKLHQFAAPQ